MTTLRIKHETTYRYRRSVALGPHRLMVRPREGRDLKLISSAVSFTPPARVTWAQDVAGNAVATALFDGSADHLHIASVADVELNASPWPVFTIAASAMVYPFVYAADEWTDLGALSLPQRFDPGGRLKRWAQGFVLGPRTDTLSLLKDLSEGISTTIGYQSRDDEGTQSPLETLDRGWGSCRDFAELFAESARCLGFGTRLVSGYLFNPDLGSRGSSGPGSTHAWAEVFVPGAGWITFDPTNRSVGGHNLIPVAVVRTIGQAVPVAGTFVGPSDAFEAMQVQVDVARTDTTPRP